MTDITELAQRMKTAAEKLDADQWQTRKGFSGIEVIVKGSLEKRHGCVSFQPVAADMADTKTARAIALFSPANVLALVEALEKAQQKIDELENYEVRQRLANAEHQLYMAELAKNNLRASRKAQFRKRKAAEQRIAELESRTVTVENLQESAYRAGLTAGWNLGLANNNEGFNKCLAAHAAGIKVEAK
ncbi:TPA: ead/Ea22-like family protein [Klebsiella pneumoniae]|nr:ead/Ea22-like family protein [Klebsiella pneumoniae]HBR6690673.1 ead/Ea22-like family protein [Klebsiella pneumoniae]HCA9553997.1 ead/Ea22-like family protein [Klebsiella pneumoniae]HCA9806433.1 ead/Ea22-like family protein [Klebsiella pneumoniae]HCF8335719.1 ead/Ea22-like family protein [Klebsiella pneumoniae]